MYLIIRYLGFGETGIIAQVLGKYMIIGYLDPERKRRHSSRSSTTTASTLFGWLR